MAKQTELLEKRTDMFKNSVLEGNEGGYHEGIWRLCKSRTADTRLRHKFLDLTKEHKI